MQPVKNMITDCFSRPTRSIFDVEYKTKILKYLRLFFLQIENIFFVGVIMSSILNSRSTKIGPSVNELLKFKLFKKGRCVKLIRFLLCQYVDFMLMRWFEEIGFQKLKTNSTCWFHSDLYILHFVHVIHDAHSNVS